MYTFAEETSYGAPTLETSDWITLAVILAVFVLLGVLMYVRRARHHA